MKILHTVESYLPARHGMSEVVRQLSEGLVALGHDVTVATSTNNKRTETAIRGVKVVSFNISGNMVRGITGSKDNYIKFVKEGNFDIITCFAAQQWATDLLFPHLSSILAKKIFVPTGFSALNDPTYSEYFIKMTDWLNTFDINVFLSDTYKDIQFARDNQIRNTTIIPNGASAQEFANLSEPYLRKKLNIPKSSLLILHVGSFTGIKGHFEAIQIFLKARIRNATLLFIGQNQEKIIEKLGRKQRYIISPIARLLKNKIILSLELGREDTVQAFKEADIYLFPSQVECSPIVLFEAAAAGLPFLSTDVGNATEIARWTSGGIIIPTRFKGDRGFADIEEGAKLLEKLSNDKPLRLEMSAKARHAWEQKFTWEKIVSQYELLYQKLLTNS
ncbi:D-inositol-3-phosphate glycosyltransferase [Dyadobacter sp. CECT 9275]|uniref:D-inositol-3-phosphate glycosyltransferase n=1 Tax=Dyadobacter helix TaxID=2822344 RepID=A0A916JEU7_9BACT|nr:glycosyltransferase family 4 protein [Dyadobacter sp. CECT 9275]CAG5007973.1 D-inositol-3-phosphate glycosyltransferase [Dyadobacter sp. CECT 9275]